MKFGESKERRADFKQKKSSVTIRLLLKKSNLFTELKKGDSVIG